MPTKRLTKAEQLDLVLSKLDHDELATIVQDLLQDDRRLLDSFLLRHQHLTGSIESLSKRYRSLFNKIVRAYSDRGFIDYRSARGFTDEVSELLSSLESGSIPASEKVSACFSIIDGLQKDVLNQIDDSDGGLGIIIYQTRTLLAATYPELSPQQQADSFKKVLKYHYEGLESYGLELDDLLNAWSEGQPDFQALYLKALDQKIAQTDHEWTREYTLRQKYQRLMQWQHLEEATALAGQYIEVAEFRRHFVQQAIDAGDFTKARQMISEGITTAEQDRLWGVVQEWREMLVTLAEQEGDTTAVREELFRIMEGDQYQLPSYKRYKATYTPEEWQTVRHDIYKQASKSGAYIGTLTEILEEENELSTLLQLVCEQGYTHLFRRYAEQLAAEFPQQVAEGYKQAIHENMLESGRKVYQQAVGDMKILAALPGGQEPMQQLLTELRQQYKNRRAMLEIFQKAFG